MHRLHRHDDEGLTLVEVVVALTLFGVLLSTVSVALTSMLTKVRSNQNRTVAANLAQRVIDRLHAVPAAQLPEGAMPTQTFRNGGDVFTVNASATTVTDGASGVTTTSECEGSGALNAKRLTVVVTWAGMGSTRPVRTDTLRQLTTGELDLAKGGVSIRVVDRAGQPVGGQRVTLSPGNQPDDTDPFGCASFTGLTAGSYTLTVTQVTAPGSQARVDWSGSTSPTRTVTVIGGAQTRLEDIAFDRQAQVRLTWPTDSRYPMLLGGTVQAGAGLGSSAFVGGDRSYPPCGTAPSAPCATSTSTSATIGGLFPFSTGYQYWAGWCSDARPTSSVPTATVTPNATSTVAAPVALIQVQTVDNKNAPTSSPDDITIRNNAGCYSAVTGRTSGGTGQLWLSLPAGTWTFTSASANVTNTVSLQPSGSPRTVPVRVR